MPTVIHEIASPLVATLILIPHDWAAGCSITPKFSTQVAEARTGLESRSSEYFIPRHEAKFRYVMDADEADALRERLLTLNGTRLALPLWFDDAANDGDFDDWKILSGPVVTYNPDAGTYTIGASAKPRIASLLFCRMKGTPSVQPKTGENCAVIEFEVFEDSPADYALTPNVVSGETPALAAPDWSVPIKETFNSQVQYEEVGNGREAGVNGDEATIRFGQKGGFLLDRPEVRKFLRFWQDKRGAWASFVSPVWYTPASPKNLWMRFAGDSLGLQFEAGHVATLTADFLEELETVEGVPEQATAARAFLYRLQFAGASAVNTWTNWESDITSNSVAFTPNKISHRNFKQTLSTKGDSIEIECFNFAGCPFVPFIKLRLERALNVTVFECDPENPDDAVQIFSGSVSSVKNTGGVLVATCDQLGGAMQWKICRFADQRSCNYTLFDPECGVDKAAWENTGTVSVIAGQVVDVTSASVDPDDFFAHGKALFGSGDTSEWRHVTRSEVISGGQRLTLHKPLEQTGAIAVKFYPGCSGEFGAGGCAKFSNQDAFGGAPRKPAYVDAVATGYKPKTGK